jgi:glycosyltransferase involved in cell wall biosynthesis
MKVLNISTDVHLLEGAPDRPNDSRDRHRLYGSLVEQLDIIVLCRTKKAAAPLQLGPRVRVYPAAGPVRAAALMKACRLAKGLHGASAYDCVTVQDPFTCGFVGRRLQRSCGLPLNVQVHAEFLDNPHWIAGSFYRRLMNRYGRRLLVRADTVRVGTTRQKTQYAADLGIAGEDIFFLPVLVKADLFRREAGAGLKEKLFACGDRQVLLYAGRFERQKNLGMLLTVVQTLASERTDFILAMVGDGPDFESFKREVRQRRLEDRVRFFGFVERTRVADYFLAADMLIVTSIFEGTCRVLVEAAFSSKPAVTTAIAGADDIVIDGETGFVTAIGDSRAFAEKISALLGSPDLRAEMGRAARRHITAFFDEEKFLQGLRDMWRATAEKGRA